MTVGLEIINVNGNPQITEGFSNLQYLGKVTTTVAISFAGRYYNNGQGVIVGDATDFIAYRCENGAATIMAKCFVRSGKLYALFYGEYVGETVTCYRFGYPSIPFGHNFEIYNSAGKIIFSDTAKFMKIATSMRGTYPLSTENDVVLATINHTTGIKCAVMIAQQVVSSRSVGWNWGDFKQWQQNFTFNSDSILVKYSLIVNEYGMGGYPLSGFTNYSFLVLDVTNL